MGDPSDSINHAWDVPPGRSITLETEFADTPGFTFGATGNWFSAVGSTNVFSHIAYVIGGERARQ